MVFTRCKKVHVEPNSFDPAILVQQKTSESKVIQTFFEPARFNKRAGSPNFCTTFFLCLGLCCTMLAGRKLFGTTCNLLVFCEATGEVVHIRLTRRASTSVPGQKICEPLVSHILVDEWLKRLVGSTYWCEKDVVQITSVTRQACTSLPGQTVV